MALPHVAAPRSGLRRPVRPSRPAHRAVRHRHGDTRLDRVRRPRLPRRGPPPPGRLGRGLAPHGPGDRGHGRRAPGGRPARLPRPDRPRLLHGQRADRAERPHLPHRRPHGEPAHQMRAAPRHTEHPGGVRRPLRRRVRPLQRAPRQDGRRPRHRDVPAPPGLAPAGLRHPHGHVRRHPPGPVRRTPPRGGLRRRDAPGVGGGRGVSRRAGPLIPSPSASPVRASAPPAVRTG